jgi:hypothetical protein
MSAELVYLISGLLFFISILFIAKGIGALAKTSLIQSKINESYIRSMEKQDALNELIATFTENQIKINEMQLKINDLVVGENEIQ